MLHQAGQEALDLLGLLAAGGLFLSLRLLGGGESLLRGLGLSGDGGLHGGSRLFSLLFDHGLVGNLIGQLYLGGAAADAKETGLGALQHLHGDIVPGETELCEALLNGGVLILAGKLRYIFPW